MARENDILLASTDSIPIIGFRSVRIKVDCPGKANGRTITLTNTAYVPAFYTNVVSLKHFIRH